MFLLDDDERVDRDAHHDRGDAVEYIGGEADRGGKRPAAAKLRKVYASGDADGDAHETGDQQDNARADDGIRHTAALLPDRRGDVREEGEVERTRALVDEVGQNRDQREDDKNR